jgi:hypothetical protein
MGTPQSRIAGRVIVRGSAEAQQWIRTSALAAAPVSSSSGCLGACLIDRLGEVKRGENSHGREQKREHERADEPEASGSPDETDKHRQ